MQQAAETMEGEGINRNTEKKASEMKANLKDTEECVTWNYLCMYS